jgi:hypothetical protein
MHRSGVRSPSAPPSQRLLFQARLRGGQSGASGSHLRAGRGIRRRGAARGVVAPRCRPPSLSAGFAACSAGVRACRSLIRPTSRQGTRWVPHALGGCPERTSHGVAGLPSHRACRVPEHQLIRWRAPLERRRPNASGLTDDACRKCDRRRAGTSISLGPHLFHRHVEHERRLRSHRQP